MKIRLLLAIVGLAISFAAPAFAQQKDAADPQIAEQLTALSEKNNGDAVALAAPYTEDAVLVNDTGPIYGREAIEKHWADVFKKYHFGNHIDEVDQYSPHHIGTADNEAWSNGEWSETIQGQNFGLIQIKGYWSNITVREGDTWKIRMDAFNVTPVNGISVGCG
jgi:ketosteroid isomerase-like protein